MNPCPNCSADSCLPGFTWCRRCIGLLAELRHAEDKASWVEEAKELEEARVRAIDAAIRAAKKEEEGTPL